MTKLMDKHEYLSSRTEIYRSKDSTNRKNLRYSALKDRYMESLEAEVESLKEENATLREDNASLIEQVNDIDLKLSKYGNILERAVNVIIQQTCKGFILCDAHTTGMNCRECWTNYLLGES